MNMRLFETSFIASIALIGAVTLFNMGDEKPVELDATDDPVVVELFTSQGCSSCPPADRLAARLAENPRVIVVSRPVTYWDRLGWKDTLAKPENTALQRAYARRGFARSGVYTPQMVVDGSAAAIGSREYRVRDLIMQAKDTPRQADISVTNNADGSVDVTITGQDKGKAFVQLLALSESENVNIGRGENGGRRILYTNVLREETNLADWKGGEMSVKITAEQMQRDDSDHYVVILRDGTYGPILAGQHITSL